MALLTCRAVLVLCTCVVNSALAEETTVKPANVESELEANSQQQVAILNRINRVNSDGSYTYGYEAADGSFKIETRDVAGNVKGVFGYVDETGKIKRVSYSTKNGTEYQSGHLLTPENETDSSSSSPLIYQQIHRPQVAQAASVTTTTEPQISARRAIFRPSNPRTTTESPTNETTKHSNPASRKLYPVYSPHQHLTKNKSSEVQANVKSIYNRTLLRKEHSNITVTESPPLSSTTRRPTHTVYGQYIRQQPTHLRRMQNHSSMNDSKNDLPDVRTNTQAQLYEDLIKALPPDDTALLFALPSKSFGKKMSSEEDDITDDISLETDGSESAVDHFYSRQTRRNSSGNGVRRQLNDDGSEQSSSLVFPSSRNRITTTDDNGDVYGGSSPTGTSRPIPSFALRPYGVGLHRPRIVDDAIHQSQFAGSQGKATSPVVAYVPEDSVPKASYGRVPYGNFGPGDFKRVYVPQQEDYGSNYNFHQYDMRDLLAQLTHLLIYQLQQNYNTRLTPAQIALIEMLGISIPPSLVQNSYFPQATLIPRRNDYPQEQIPYSPTDETYLTNEDPRFYVRRRPFYRPRPNYVTPPTQPLPYDNQQPDRYDPRIPYTPTPGLQVFLPRYYPQQPLPYDSPEVQYSHGGRSSGRSPQVAMPQEILPDEYRDAVFLRMILAARAQQRPSKGLPQAYPTTSTEESKPVLSGYTTPRPVYDNQQSVRTVLVQPRPVFLGQESGASSTTTSRPRTLAPVRSVQILDPVTEESTVKRSAENATTSATKIS